MEQGNPANRDSNHESKPPTHDDARLRSFLRKAVAVIAAERGLNARSRIKLESLAKHQKLPDDLFAEAIRRLQENDQSVDALSHYEKAFVLFLSKEMQKLPGQVLSIAAEQRALDLAAGKYQIAPPRAEQLIQQQAELDGIERVSRSEAETYGSNLISEAIGERMEVGQELQEELYRKAKKLGLDRERVDLEIHRLLQWNRKRQKPRRGWRWLWAGLPILVAALAVVGFYAGWWELMTANPNPIPVKPPVEDVVPKQPAERSPEWLSESTTELVELTAKSELPGLTKFVFSNEPAERVVGYQSLVEAICSRPLSNRQLFENLACQLYYEEPDSQSSRAIIEHACGYLRPQTLGIITSMKIFEDQYRANHLMGLMHACIPNATVPHNTQNRKTELAVQMRELTGINPQALQFTEYVQQSESEIAITQWNSMVQNCWESPSRAAILVKPLVGLTRSRMPSEALMIYRSRLLQAILQLDSNQWSSMQGAIRDSISAAGENELVDWIEMILQMSNPELVQFAGTLLLRKANVQVTSTGQAVVERALRSLLKEYRNRTLQPLLARNQRITGLTDDLLTESRVELMTVSPNQIAKIAFVTDLNLAICQQVRSGQFLEDSDFAKLDELLGRSDVRLRELISLPGKSLRTMTKATATASDRNRKDNSFEILKDLSFQNSTRRINALAQLERVAGRFQNISYDEATILAEYFLADVNDAEMVNVQNLIPSFADWPNLGLAIADQLPRENSRLDRALTIARLLTGKEFELEKGNADWANSLQQQLIQAIADQVEGRLDTDPSNTKSDWIRLESFLADLYRNRATLLFEESSRTNDYEELANSDRASDILLAIIQAKLTDRSLATDAIRRLQAGVGLIVRGSFGEMERTILANQLMFEVLCSEIERDSRIAEGTVRQIRSQMETSFDQKTVLADQLYEVSVGLLRLAKLKRKRMIRKMVEIDPGVANESN